MSLTDIGLILLLISNVGFWLILRKQTVKQNNEDKNFQSLRQEVTQNIQTELSNNRKEQQVSSQSLREEITNNMQQQNQTISTSFEALSKSQSENFKSFETRFSTMLENSKSLRQEVANSIQKNNDFISSSFEKFSQSQSESLKDMQKDNKEQLEKMRITVDEKLQSTLERRLSESFNQVNTRLQEVYQGLGEMKTLAHGVGDLKRVLTNVKSRGTWGEFQLGNILEEILTPEQYQKNVSLTKGSRESVEYAVKLPGQGDGVCVYLPIDSKFPQSDYERLIKAQEESDLEMAKLASDHLERAIKKEAQIINNKYIHPPQTTNFAIMFLPTEGLYAEVLRRPGLADSLQRQYRVIISGPTTLAALLNSLSVGFRTLAIQKRSSDVWKLLGAIKTQFGTFSELLDKVQDKLNKASSDMTKASNRSRMIEKKLKGVEKLHTKEAKDLMLEGE